MKFMPTELPGVIIVEPDVHRDERGFFLETYHQREVPRGRHRGAVRPGQPLALGARARCAACTRSCGGRRGSCVRAVDGEMFDVAVDIRRGSPTFGRWVGVVLSGENFRQLYIPPGFAHGFCVLSEPRARRVQVHRLLRPDGRDRRRLERSRHRHRLAAREPVLSAKDAAAPPLAELSDRLPRY